ncbi:hypothetical protein [Psychroserpens jangbogonensis]|uniref:hypothetical protein n=1 Tax=Psychroserpens jangbogonensis TaxID=1484460 RepID=UPI00053DD1A3|nr:hypothetical protein [Psychroserpens jangbogonensis]
MSFLLKRLSQKNSWNKVFKQRLTEPFHLNVIALFVFIFGSFRKKVAYDLVIRPQHAFGLLNAADQAKLRGFNEITIIEFGVANGAGLMNLIAIANKVTKETGVKIHIYGFDTGEGMPEPIDYRDHPEYYNTGDFPMNKDLLEEKIKGKATIIYGPIKEKVSHFITNISKNAPIGFVSIDVDYYSSTKEVLELLKAEATCFLPLTYVYLDDIFMSHHNEKCGEMLAVSEFNEEQPRRQLSYHRFFENQRIFKNANWVKQLYYFHVLDHPYRSDLKRDRKAYVLDNPYLKFEGNKKQFD